MTHYKNKLMASLFSKRWLCIFVIILGVGWTDRLKAASELERREARVQATYLTHLIEFTRWSESHLPKRGESPTILVLGDEKNGFIASLEFLLAQSDLRIGGRKPRFIHLSGDQSNRFRTEMSKGCQVVFLMPGSTIKVQEVRKLSPSAVIFGFGRDFVTVRGGDVGFVSARNRVKLILSDAYFRRTSPKLSAQIANLRSVVEIIRSSKP